MMSYARRAAVAVAVVPLALGAAPVSRAVPHGWTGVQWVVPTQTPQVKVALSYTRVGRTVTMIVALKGYVYEPLDADGTPIPFTAPASIDIGTGQAWAWGDKSIEEGSDGGDVHCGKPHRLKRLKDDFALTKKYKKAGTYTFTYTFYACGLKGGKVTATVPITIP